MIKRRFYGTPVAVCDNAHWSDMKTLLSQLISALQELILRRVVRMAVLLFGGILNVSVDSYYGLMPVGTYLIPF